MAAATPVCVLGLGLIGGSMVRALRRADRPVFGWNRGTDAVEAARRDGHDATADLDAALGRAADVDALVVLAVPVPALAALLAQVARRAPAVTLTDVTSVKAAVSREVAAAGLLTHFVGGHPMAGTAHSGWAAGSADLFDGATWVLSVDDHVDPARWLRVADLAITCGAVVVPARSDEHDAAAAAVSHAPHLLAEAIAAAATEVPLALPLAAGSFRDGTRVAATAPELVRAMCEANGPDVVAALDRTLALLGRARDSLAAGDGVAELVGAGHEARRDYERWVRRDIDRDVTVGEDGWRARLAAAGRAGGVLRAVPPGPGSRR